MKLNLWLIANQLSEYDIETRISSDTERNISGPLPVSAMGSVYVRNEGSDIICSCEQGTIIVHDMDDKEGFLLIQSIFNWYDSWLEKIEKALQLGDYRMFVHLCAQAFTNPVMLLDSNSLLLGMDCRAIPITRIPEWRFLYEKEQSSVAYYLTMSEALKKPVRKYNDNVYRFNISSKDEENRAYKTSGLCGKFRYLSHDYGQLTVLDKKRSLNPGDVALMELLVEKSSLMFAATDRGTDSDVNIRVMNDILEHRYVPKELLEYHYSIITRKKPDSENRINLFLLRLDATEETPGMLELLSNLMTRRYPTIYHWTYHDGILMLAYVPEPEMLIQQIASQLNMDGFGDTLHIGVSLPFDRLEELPYFYEQALFAMKRGKQGMPGFFYDYGYAYLLENVSLEHKLLACEPLCRKIWQTEPDKQEFLLTLASYLRMERATAATAEQLFIHRNTINYRVKFLKEYADWDYNDPNLRDYLRLSIHYLTCWSELH